MQNSGVTVMLWQVIYKIDHDVVPGEPINTAGYPVFMSIQVPAANREDALDRAHKRLKLAVMNDQNWSFLETSIIR